MININVQALLIILFGILIGARTLSTQTQRIISVAMIVVGVLVAGALVIAIK